MLMLMLPDLSDNENTSHGNLSSSRAHTASHRNASHRNRTESDFPVETQETLFNLRYIYKHIPRPRKPWPRKHRPRRSYTLLGASQGSPGSLLGSFWGPLEAPLGSPGSSQSTPKSIPEISWILQKRCSNHMCFLAWVNFWCQILK